ncbi:hypothetical protein [Mesorhizobium sp. LNJC405B00]|uniref:hypothetical protein n=1 Tax=Mesorhizobium sp. LNJC405B00 TaxID=1287281 RepID=UPI0012EBF3AF|nr:hypothetical protein [Mesorhizobium sp. LNJC405B00]
MIKEIIAALLETDWSRAFFRGAFQILTVLVILAIALLVIVGGIRAYSGAPIEFWVLKIGGATTKTPDIHKVAFVSRAVVFLWETDDACVDDMKAAIGDVTGTRPLQNGTLVWADTANGRLLAGCAGQDWAGHTFGEVFAFGNDNKEINQAVDKVMGVMPRMANP